MLQYLLLLFFCFFFICQAGGAQSLVKMPLRKMTDGMPAVVIFLSTTCPICEKYAGKLPEFVKRYPNVKFVGIFTKWEDLESIQQFATAYQLNFSLFLDKKHRLLRQLDATTTPEVFLIDQNGEIQYHGAIDNWFYGLGKYRPAANEHYLTDALDAFLNGKDIVIKKTKSIGCEIGR